MPTEVLFVDDDPLLLASLGRCLRDHFELKTFDSAVNALEFLETEGPVPVVISDMRMPVMDGAEFVLRAKQVSPRTQFLMLTGTPNDEHQVCRRHGNIVSGFMNKPCSPARLEEAISKAMAVYEASTAERDSSVTSV